MRATFSACPAEASESSTRTTEPHRCRFIASASYHAGPHHPRNRLTRRFFLGALSWTKLRQPQAEGSSPPRQQMPSPCPFARMAVVHTNISEDKQNAALSVYHSRVADRRRGRAGGQSAFEGFDPNANSKVWAAVVQPDGKKFLSAAILPRSRPTAERRSRATALTG